MAIAQVFEKAPARLVGRRPMPTGSGALTWGDAPRRSFEPIGVPEPLGTLLPEGLRRGEALMLSGDAGAGLTTVDYLTLALLAGALRQGLWCAAVGVRGLGGAALAGLVGDAAVGEGALQRLLVVARPGERWAEIAAVLADGVDVVLLAPPGPVPERVARRVDARLRQGAGDEARHRAALLVLGAWPGARTTLRVRRLGWSGFGDGVGHLIGGRALIGAEDRARRVRTVQVDLPGGLGVSAPLSGQAESEREREREESAMPRLTAVA